MVSILHSARDVSRASLIVIAATVLTLALLAISPAFNSSTGLGADAIPHLTATLGVSSGAAVAIWNAFDSWWAAALSVALIPLGFGAWAVTIRLTFTALVKQLGKQAARKAAIRF